MKLYNCLIVSIFSFTLKAFNYFFVFKLSKSVDLYPPDIIIAKKQKSAQATGLVHLTTTLIEVMLSC